MLQGIFQMTPFHAGSYNRFIEIKSNLERKKTSLGKGWDHQWSLGELQN